MSDETPTHAGKQIGRKLEKYEQGYAADTDDFLFYSGFTLWCNTIDMRVLR